MEHVCDKCAKPTKESDYIKCQGFCETMAHFKCAGLSSQLFTKVKSHTDNVLWFCDGCLKLLKWATFRPTIAALGNTIAELVTQQTAAINELKEVIRKGGMKSAYPVASKSDITPRAPQNNWPSIHRPAPKRRREDQFISNRDIIVGTNANLSTTVATVPLTEKKFWIYLSRIHPDVPVQNVHDMVKECLQCDDPPEVVKLVKKDVDMNSLRFISFKVGVDPKLKTAALSPSTWPAGIFFREFEDYGSKNGRGVTTVTPMVASPVIP
ncbi:uncharacterized protein LOC128740747 [Sabethes cyaneus]|uniref:uncharacterized protein LOC128740747 n=1 Tax=Sabethes cyaneus TaxID=53552 RepID=UPI00237DE5E4|nr:uncharacterized protein LOC128740747 [Sabethes cyaneus]